MLSGFSCQPDRVCSVTEGNSQILKATYLRGIHQVVSSRGKIDEASYTPLPMIYYTAIMNQNAVLPLISRLTFSVGCGTMGTISVYKGVICIYAEEHETAGGTADRTILS